MKVNITLGSDTFVVEQESTEVTPSLVELFRTWANAKGLGGAVDLDTATQQLEDNNAGLAAAVVANTPQEVK